jgi:hypothetical protein
MQNNPTKPTEDVDVARVQFFRSIERLLKDAEEAQRDRDLLLRLLGGQHEDACVDA